MKKILLFFIPLLVLAGCRDKNSFSVKGTLPAGTGKFITVSRMDISTTEAIDSSRIRRDGSFRFRIKSEEPDFYKVGVSPTNFITLLAQPGEKIQISFRDKNLFTDYAVEGSEGSSQIKILDDKLLRTRFMIDSLNTIYQKALELKAADSTLNAIYDEIVSLVKLQRRFNIEFIINNTKSLASVKAVYQKINDEVYVLYETRDLQYMKIISDSLLRHYPASRHTKLLLGTLEEGMRRMNAARLNQLVEQLPETKLDPVLNDINGRKVALSSLRGKYVLLAFWSSESRECIAENLQLKEFYKLYNRKGFEIYQISLDSSEEAWKAAVKFDELPWISTREPDPANQRNAYLFNVKSIPANYLFDPQGNIVASNLHGKPLQLKLAQLFSN
ncbi:MAG: AhpC/TSA family protein [Bacteroidales bacterium]|nr:AhpC/TSA family protein [Bacteroidales bacterium]